MNTHRSGHDLIRTYDAAGSQVIFTDGSVERFNTNPGRQLDLMIAASHHAVRDVHVIHPLGMFHVSVETADGFDPVEISQAVRNVAESFLPSNSSVVVECRNWC